MPWQIPTLLYILFANVLMAVTLKKVADMPGMLQKFRLQYIYCFVFSVLVGVSCWFLGWVTFDGNSLLAAAIGSVSVTGTYAYWRAVRISQSKTSLFTQLDDLTALSLGFLVLGETNLLNLPIVAGIVLCLGAALGYAFKGYKPDPDKKPGALLGWVLYYSFIWGLEMFIMRYFAVQGMSLPSFLIARYSGGLVGAFFMAWFVQRTGLSDEDASKPSSPITRKQAGSVLVLAFFVWGAMFIGYWAKMLAPIALFQPIEQAGEMVFPTLVGLYLFKEKDSIKPGGWIWIVLAFVGAAILFFSY